MRRSAPLPGQQKLAEAALPLGVQQVADHGNRPAVWRRCSKRQPELDRYSESTVTALGETELASYGLFSKSMNSSL
jgi:hypothetical protein